MSVKRVDWHLAKFLPARKEGFWVLQVNMVDKPTQWKGFSSSAPPPGFVLLVDFGFYDTKYFFCPCRSLLGGLFQISLSLSRGGKANGTLRSEVLGPLLSVMPPTHILISYPPHQVSCRENWKSLPDSCHKGAFLLL